jgi:Cu/Zn superoxide dismutase
MGHVLQLWADLEAFHVHTEPPCTPGVSFRIQTLQAHVRAHRNHDGQFPPEEGDIVGTLDRYPVSQALPGQTHACFEHAGV